MRPADQVPAAFRSKWADAYRCHPIDPRRWLAVCPGCWADLAIIEHGQGGRVSLYCGGGCHERRVLNALQKAPGDERHIAEVGAQVRLVEEGFARTRRATLARREVASWR